ncbi:Uncharacterised protein [Mycobacteroides abscessus subsp. abscessus]|nr:Uncharacterised protein [Mycobacteroides abscessus subsp. abscessus]
MDPSIGTRTGPSGPARLRCRAAAVVEIRRRTTPVAAVNNTTPSGLRTATAPTPDRPTTIPSGAAPIDTTRPAGGVRN